MTYYKRYFPFNGGATKVALGKLDKVRGNACVSRREIISNFKKEDKAKIIEKYKVGDIIKRPRLKVTVHLDVLV